ncbi:hypothetical protein TEQG_03220 [Trichophyton equinum CBS 127.97]|uniref:Uncharacterized protein n=1 Tax=Trichophyton equinum (strain ATCC MYA-4606 / CBS 127.97) TaxID=559882 RepID=F2PQM1_TRIEC|nr:hypothetical protein TEQG_03220 [Trichophyton equinum CBS 127.97]
MKKADLTYLTLEISGHRKRRTGSPLDGNSNNKTTKRTSTTTYNRNFEQKLIDHSIYPSRYNGGQKPAKPSNWQELNKRLAQSRASLSLSKFSEQEFEDFVDVDLNASKKESVQMQNQIVSLVLALKAKGTDKPYAVATRQACYSGALGARGIH